MGAHPGRSTDTALDILIKQIQAAWQADIRVASLLSLDMTGALDRVVPVQLMHNLSIRCISQWLVDFISSFLFDRTTSMCFPGYSLSSFLSQQGVPQVSPLFPILFPFYNAGLIDICNSPDLSATGISFIGDANV
jgi:hypothetical protein